MFDEISGKKELDTSICKKNGKQIHLLRQLIHMIIYTLSSKNEKT
jgi:hypothetical protein